MDTTNQDNINTGQQTSFGDRIRTSKALIPTLAVMVVAVGALAAALLVNNSKAQPGDAAYIAPPPQVSALRTDQNAANKASLKAEDMRQDEVSGKAPEQKPAVRAPVATPKRAPVVVAQAAPRAAVCATCGTVESVVAVQRQGQVNGVPIAGQTIGIGTVAGGVVGGLLGNQVGGGNGKTAMTVLGAAGGAFAGNAIEKNMKKVTVYQMNVRMQDGSLRTVEQPTAVQTGSRVIVEGNTLRMAS